MICAFESDIPFCYMKMQKKLSYGRSGRCLSGRFFFTSGKLLQKVFISTATMETVEMKKNDTSLAVPARENVSLWVHFFSNTLSIASLNELLSMAPVAICGCWPMRIESSEGLLRIPNRPASSCSSSVFTL